jgi:hypothetical protein
LYFPEAVFRKRLAAARLVLIFGMENPLVSLITDLGGGLRHAFRPARGLLVSR